ETAKTKSARKQQLTRLMWVLLAAAAILFIGVGGFFGATRTGVGCAISIPAQQPSSTDYTSAAPARDCIYLEKVNSEQDHSIGLSKYDMLPQTQGMLFVFDGSQSACMWMKDMNFAIDIVWLNEKK